MNKARTPLLIATALVLVASACLAAQPVPGAAPASPTVAVPAASQTQPVFAPTASATALRVAPSAAPLITTTAFPSITPLPPPSATPTETPFGYKPSSTPTVTVPKGSETPDPADGATDDWGSDTRCTLTGKTPPDGTIVKAGDTARVSWELLNSGVKNWQANQIMLVFLEGARQSVTGTKLGLEWDVRVGSTTNTPPFTILAPKTSGNYRSVWGLRLIKSGHIFCTFTYNITVP